MYKTKSSDLWRLAYVNTMFTWEDRVSKASEAPKGQ